MSAAMEGCIEGVPSVGFSLCNHSYEADFEPAKPFIKKIIQLVLENGLPKDICLNVNIPAISTEKIKGIKICRQARAYWSEELDERLDPRGGKYFWLTGVFKNLDEGSDTDEWALYNEYISVVPIKVDFTAYQAMEHLKTWDFRINE